MGSMFFVFMVSLTLSGCVERFPRQIPGIAESRQFRWGERHVLLMDRNGTVEVKLAQEHNCEACQVRLRSVCKTHKIQVKDCPKSIIGKRVKTIAATAMTMHFTLADKYLCLHQNRTFYAVAHTNVRNLEECAFYIEREKSGYDSIYHFRYPQRKRDCRLKQRRSKAATTTTTTNSTTTTTCHRFYLRKGKGDILTVTRQKSFKESRWLHER